MDIRVYGYFLMPEDGGVGHNTSGSVGSGGRSLRPLSLTYLPGSLCPMSLAPLPLHLRALAENPEELSAQMCLRASPRTIKGLLWRKAWLSDSQEATGGLRLAVGSLGYAGCSKMDHQTLTP